jgi:hypothetical protein
VLAHCTDFTRVVNRHLLGFNPKKSGPDQAVPVIFCAMAESER